jgi:hypothetical protein
VSATITPAARALIRAGGRVTLSIEMADSPAGRAALEGARRRLLALNDSDVGAGEGRGPSSVADPVAVPQGFLLMVDLDGVPTRERKLLPDLLAAAWDEAGADGYVDAPQRMTDSPFLALQQREAISGQVVANGRQRRFPVSAREPESWNGLVEIGFTWLAEGAGERVVAGVVCAGGPFALDLDGSELRSAVSAVLSTGGSVELARRASGGDKYVRFEAILHARLSAAWLPSEQSTEAVAVGLESLTELLEQRGDALLWAGADLKDSARSGYAVPFGDGPIATDDTPRPIPLGPRVDVVTAAYPWQILSPAVRSRLPEVLAGAEERPLPGGATAIRFGPWQSWAPGEGRAVARTAAWSALGPVIAADPSRRRSG